MRIVTAQELESWLASGEILEQDGRGPKVIRLGAEQIIKIFRPRRRLWLARLAPQAKRFETNANKLMGQGVHTPTVQDCFWIDKAKAITGCRYIPLPGRSLEQLYKESYSEFESLLPEFASFIYSLHQRGIYFRSLHLGNVLLLPDGSFGLIDFLDIHFKSAPLGKSLVKRNLEHLHGYLQRNKLVDFPWDNLQAAYTKAAKSN